ncbi:hypothetical protein [Pararhizobium haloflavum]|uniref:hypothetical protein n=1 Tax=Pararhizobium haloflavum TaxID=2037914 RepID=UPI000C195B84|nr:hypothetical protein [Pararhizobium haloflavum]
MTLKRAGSTPSRCARKGVAPREIASRWAVMFGAASLVAMAGVFGPAASGPAHAASSENPDWPCIQRLVPRISSAQVWAGPELKPEDWLRDQDVREVATQIAARRLSVEEASDLIAEFAEAQPEAERNAKLTALFGRTLEIINGDRGSLIAGIGRFAESQRQRAERIRSARVAAQSEAGAQSDTQSLPQNLAMDIRIYQERRQALTYLCEQPVLLDQRAFALGRAINSHMVRE